METETEAETVGEMTYIYVILWKARNYSKYGTKERKKKVLYKEEN